MTKILEFTPSQEDAVTARILVMVHRAVDQHFPHTTQPSRQFTKTVFSDDQETTAIRSISSTPEPETPLTPVVDPTVSAPRRTPSEVEEYELPNLERDWYSVGATILLIVGLGALAYVLSHN